MFKIFSFFIKRNPQSFIVQVPSTDTKPLWLPIAVSNSVLLDFSLMELLTLRSDLYLKLVISSLDYSSPDWGSRSLLSKALKEGSEASKLYATRFLGVLIRSRTPNIAQWGIELLVSGSYEARFTTWA